MGESVSEATITQWLKNVGDTVAADEAVVEVATDKVDSEVASEYAGVIKEILHPVNAVVGVDAPLAVIETAEEVTQDVTPVAVPKTIPTSAPSAPKPPEKVEDSPQQYMEQAQALVNPVSTVVDGQKRFYSPLVKNIAKEENISDQELATVPGSGKDGRVTKADILAFIKNRKAPAVTSTLTRDPSPSTTTSNARPTVSFTRSDTDEIVPMTRMEQMISDHMTHSLKTSAHVQSFI
jgi:2-oxoglutarate dehydrogenase E2 component (dihydrolipoamide succinyltransferase)